MFSIYPGISLATDMNGLVIWRGRQREAAGHSIAFHSRGSGLTVHVLVCSTL